MDVSGYVSLLAEIHSVAGTQTISDHGDQQRHFFPKSLHVGTPTLASQGVSDWAKQSVRTSRVLADFPGEPESVESPSQASLVGGSPGAS